MVMMLQDFVTKLQTSAEIVPDKTNRSVATNIATGDWNVDRVNSAKNDDQWHDHVLSFIGSLVAKNIDDQIILLMAEALTLPGYTVDQTKAEMRVMIDGARRKGYNHSSEVEVDFDNILDGYSILSIDELTRKEFAPIKWLIEPLLPCPSLTMLAGPPKVGKSWLCLFLALEVANHGHEVLYIANEDNERRLKSRVIDVNPFPPNGIHFLAGISSIRLLPKGEDAHDFIRALKDRYPKLKCLVVDTLASIRAEPPTKSKKDDYTLSEEEFSSRRKLAHELELAIILVHHTRKATENDSSPVERLLGSQGIAATVETILVMKQETGSQDVALHVTGKDVEQQDWVLPWQAPGFGWPREMTEARLGPFQQVCLEYVKEQPRCMQAAIAQAFDKDPSQVSRAISKLIECRLLTRDPEGRLVAK